MPVDPARAKSVFLNASDLADPAERAAYLERACDGDVALRDRVEALLRASDDAPATEATGDHTPRTDAGPATLTVTADYQAKPAADVLIAGRYTLQARIGEGGMGEVWVAKQSEPVKRKVALKLIKPGMDSRALLARFEQERQALAMMDHPNIAKVFDAGLTPSGQPFFAMELVNGLPLNKFCDEARLATKDRLELFVTICQAVQHAHQKGIVHRDLKPANILITMIDGRPTPKIIDFGVAKATAGKLTDESMSTQFGAVVGTIEYMAPEQAGFSGEDVDTRADIYSLGVVLYEMLTGLRPIDARRLKHAALTEMIRIIREEEPSKPSTRLSTDEALPSMAALRQIEPGRLMALLRGELDWVVMKCLEKQRERRYETANGLARDVQRYLNDEAVEARPPSARYRVSKFLKRNKGPVLAASFVLLALAAGFIGTAWGLVRADRARRAEADQRVIAVEEKTRAEAQRSRAEEREQQAIDAVKRFRDAVANNSELKNSPALESLRKTLLKEPLSFFKALRDRLQTDRDTRPESLARLAQASFDLGRLNNDIGDKQDALMAYQESLAVDRKLADDYPDVAKYRSNLAHSYNDIGYLLTEIGEPAEAMKAYEAALAIRRKLAEDHPEVAEYLRDLAGSYNNIGVLLKATGKLVEAMKVNEAALAIRRKLADDHPGVAKHLSELGSIYTNIGVLLKETGKPAEAMKAYEAALAIDRKLAADHPDDAKYLGNLAMSHHNIGNLLNDTGRPAAAIKPHQAAMAIWSRLSHDNPTVILYLTELARSHGGVSASLSRTGKPVEALKSAETALAIWRKLVEEHPTVVLYQSELATSHNHIGGLLMGLGKPAQAMQEVEADLTIRRKLAREHPESPDFASNLGAALNNSASIHLGEKRFEEARLRLREAVKWQRKAFAANPANPIYRQFLTLHLATLIKAQKGLGDAAGEAEAKRELASFVESDPATVDLDARLAALVHGDQTPNDQAERLKLAQRAYDKAQYAAAAKLWAEALAADPKLGDDRQTQHRYNAACAAALAGCGKGMDDPAPNDAAKGMLRKQALDWLTADLIVWSKLVESGPLQAKPSTAQTLKHWQADADLAGIRDPAEMKKLPDDERAALRRFWNDVDALLTKIGDRR